MSEVRRAQAAPAGRAAGRIGVRRRLSVWAMHALPQHRLSRLTLAATRVRARWFKNLLTRVFLACFALDMSEALEPDPYRYRDLNALFTRALRPGARPIAPPGFIASPVDGTVSECGAIERDRLLQAKGRTYRLAELLAGQPWGERFVDGLFATLYLAPPDYHRVHMPLDGRLRDTVYVPGRLFSVNAAAARLVPRLFARNERVLALFEGDAGAFALVLVGALNVGSIGTVWAGDVTPAAHRRIERIASPPIALAKGEEMGRFNMGSTVILLIEGRAARWDVAAGARVRVGQAIGEARCA